MDSKKRLCRRSLSHWSRLFLLWALVVSPVAVFGDVRGVDFGLGAPESPLYERFDDLPQNGAQQNGSGQNAPAGQSTSGQTGNRQAANQASNGQSTAQARDEANKSVPVSKQQPKRILGLMPNYRAVSAGAIRHRRLQKKLL